MSSGHPRFTKSSIDRLKKFELNNINIKKLDFIKSIELYPSILLYLDPPYLTENFLYGNKGDAHRYFKHYILASILKNRNNWILSYNNCKEITDIYKDYTILYPKWSYGMSNDKKSKEVLILSNDLSEYHKIGIL
jgi:DNA adenine methylase